MSAVLAYSNISSMPAHPSRKAVLKRLLAQAEFPTDYVSLMFRRINVDDSWHGKPVSVWLDSLSCGDAADCIYLLRGIIG